MYQAFYVLSDVQAQMRAYVFDSIRASLCQMDLDHAFESKDEISMSLKTHLHEIMSSYGISILNALVTDLSPDPRVRDGRCMSFTFLLFLNFFASNNFSNE